MPPRKVSFGPGGWPKNIEEKVADALSELKRATEELEQIRRMRGELLRMKEEDGEE